MSEELVPKDRPYGERKKIKAQMRAGNIPTEVQTGGAQLPAMSTGSPPSARPSSPGIPPNYDVFANRQPTEAQFPVVERPPVTTGGAMAQIANTAANPFIREFATRLVQLRRG